MSSRPLVNFYQTLLSVARLQLKHCPGTAEKAVVRKEIKRLEQKLASCQRGED